MDPTPPQPTSIPVAPSDGLDPSSFFDSPTRLLVFFLLAGAVLVYLFFKFLGGARASEKLRQAAENVVLPPVGIAAGWYATPDEKQERYHDGEAWTEQFRPLSPKPAPEEAMDSPESLAAADRLFEASAEDLNSTADLTAAPESEEKA